MKNMSFIQCFLMVIYSSIILYAIDTSKVIYGPALPPGLKGIDTIVTLDVKKINNIDNTNMQLKSPSSKDSLESIDSNIIESESSAELDNSNIFEFNFDSFKNITTVSFFYTGIAFGDVDNDGKTETVLITPKQIHIFRYIGEEVQTVGRIINLKNKDLVAVNVADINQNGYDEIFVTSINISKSSFHSFILEWNGKNFDYLEKKVPYLFRVVKDKDNNNLLMGQKAKKGTAFKSNIYLFKYSNSEYVRDKLIAKYYGINVLSMAYGSIITKKTNSIAGYKSDDEINIFRSGKKAFYKHGEKTGGNNEFINNVGTSHDLEKVFLPLRIVSVKPSNQNAYLFIVKNYDVARNLLANFRKFKKFHIESLKWNGIGLETIQKSKVMPGFLRDFEIADFNNDGKKEFIASIISRHGKKFGKDNRCNLVYYSLK